MARFGAWSARQELGAPMFDVCLPRILAVWKPKKLGSGTWSPSKEEIHGCFVIINIRSIVNFSGELDHRRV